MTFEHLIAAIWKRSGPTVRRRDVSRVLSELVEEISSAVKRGERVAIPGLGVFEVRYRKAREVRNPRTRAPMQLPDCQTLGFTASKHHRRTT